MCNSTDAIASKNNLLTFYPSTLASILSRPIRSKAKLVGANRVKGPPASRLSERSVSSSALTRTENSGRARSRLITLLWPRLRGLRPAQNRIIKILDLVVSSKLKCSFTSDLQTEVHPGAIVFPGLWRHQEEDRPAVRERRTGGYGRTGRGHPREICHGAESRPEEGCVSAQQNCK